MSNEIKRFHSILDIVLSDLQYVPSDLVLVVSNIGLV